MKLSTLNFIPCLIYETLPMPIPDYQSLMLPVLRVVQSGEAKIADVIVRLGQELALADEEITELLPSGRQTIFSNRVHWAKTYLAKAGLIENTKRGHFKITERGIQALAGNPKRIDNNYLSQYEEFNEFRRRVREDESEVGAIAPSEINDIRTPDEIMRAAHSAVEKQLRQDLIDRILANSPEFFERLVVDLLVAMGYGGSVKDAGRQIGKSGDGGVDVT